MTVCPWVERVPTPCRGIAKSKCHTKMRLTLNLVTLERITSGLVNIRIRFSNDVVKTICVSLRYLRDSELWMLHDYGDRQESCLRRLLVACHRVRVSITNIIYWSLIKLLEIQARLDPVSIQPWLRRGQHRLTTTSGVIAIRCVKVSITSSLSFFGLFIFLWTV